MKVKRPLLLLQLAEAEIAPGQQQVGTDGFGVAAQRFGRRVLGADGWFARTEYARLFKGHLLHRVAQKGLVIQIHRRYHRYVAVKNIHRVQPAAEVSMPVLKPAAR